LGYEGCEISLLFTDDDGIRALNSTYRGRDKPTNVLSFSMLEGEGKVDFSDLLGDVVISVETAESEALEAGIHPEERISQLLVHGVLHLSGFDHETNEAAFREMEDKSRELLRLIETNPDLDVF
jgi:probable rRNA maturation factor